MNDDKKIQQRIRALLALAHRAVTAALVQLRGARAVLAGA